MSTKCKIFDEFTGCAAAMFSCSIIHSSTLKICNSATSRSNAPFSLQTATHHTHPVPPRASQILISPVAGVFHTQGIFQMHDTAMSCENQGFCIVTTECHMRIHHLCKSECTHADFELHKMCFSRTKDHAIALCFTGAHFSKWLEQQLS